MTYHLEITAEEDNAARMFAHAYESCRFLSILGKGVHNLEESEAWKLKEAYYADTEDDSTDHPVFAPTFQKKLTDFIGRIV